MGQLASGQLRERVTLLTTAATAPDADGYGYVPSGPDTEQLLWARVRPLRTDENLRLGQLANAESYEITLRNRPGVSAKQRIRWNGKTMNVLGVRPDENREYLLLTCVHGGQ